jgi:2,3-bisphosphoglycerate-independent phosphoglycerate mutase
VGKVYLIILDGAADRPISSLDKQTPLEAASTAALDTLAAKSQQSMVTVIREDIAPESDSGAMALLSYDPMKYYTGRGPLEGLGLGFIEPGNRSVAFRVNFASFNVETNSLDRRTARGLSDNELQALTIAINSEVRLGDFQAELKLHAYGHHRGILGIKSVGAPLSGQITNTDPGLRNVGPFGIPVSNFAPHPLPARPRTDTKEAQRTADIVNAFVERSSVVLRHHPVNESRGRRGELQANIILIRDGGDAPNPLPEFYQRFGASIFLFGQIPAEHGLAQLIGGDFAYSFRRAEETDAAYLNRALNAVLEAHADVVFIHLKGPDEPGHDGLPHEKVQAIELIDRHFIGPLLDRTSSEDVVAITSDHATPCELGMHSADKVPTVACGPGIVPDSTSKFGERYATEGTLAVSKGIELMPFLISSWNYSRSG